MPPQLSSAFNNGTEVVGPSVLLKKAAFGCSPAQLRAWDVYCEGPLLEAVQMSRVFQDCKTFVDMPMKRDPEEILAAFENLDEADKQDPVKLDSFVWENFHPAGSDMTPCFPTDYDPEPEFLAHIEDQKERAWAQGMHRLWPELVRHVEADVSSNPQRHSLLPRQFPVVVPGGRFRETYYWDTFWTVRGLLVSGMVDTARGVVLNLLGDVDQFGFVPNGGRLYYTHRSQPPLLSDMVCDIYMASGDVAFLARALPTLELEYAFWMDPKRGRAVHIPHRRPTASRFSSNPSLSSFNKTGMEGAPQAQKSQPPPPPPVSHVLNRYWGGAALESQGLARGPRPESFREDAETLIEAFRIRPVAEFFGYADLPQHGAEAGPGAGAGALPPMRGGIGRRCCQELAAAAESGWDFSSRWAVNPAQEGAHGREGEFFLGDTATTGIVPADLNAFLHRFELNLARVHHALDRQGQVPGSCQGTCQGPSLLSITEMQMLLLEHRRGHDLQQTRTETTTEAGAGVGGGASRLWVDSGGSGRQVLCSGALGFLERAWERASAMDEVMWDPVHSIWRDLILETGRQSSSITPAAFSPLWAGLLWPGAPGLKHRLHSCVAALKGSGLVLPGGVQTSLRSGTGQQWDSYNAWPPLQWLLIQGLRLAADTIDTGSLTVGMLAQESSLSGSGARDTDPTAALGAASSARALAEELERSWLGGGMMGWERDGAMFEKYDARGGAAGKGGGGGEYEVQVGFGWTNGVALDLLAGAYRSARRSAEGGSNSSLGNHVAGGNDEEACQ